MHQMVKINEILKRADMFGSGEMEAEPAQIIKEQECGVSKAG